jgi:hypothetical protein
MSCGCGLKPNHHTDPANAIRGPAGELPRGALDELKAHMLQEEDHVIPHLPVWAQTRLLTDHARFWHDLALGRMPNRYDLEAHAGLEEQIYAEFGFTHEDTHE